MNLYQSVPWREVTTSFSLLVVHLGNFNLAFSGVYLIMFLLFLRIMKNNKSKTEPIVLLFSECDQSFYRSRRVFFTIFCGSLSSLLVNENFHT